MGKEGERTKRKWREERGGIADQLCSHCHPLTVAVPPVMVLVLVTEVLVNINETCLWQADGAVRPAWYCHWAGGWQGVSAAGTAALSAALCTAAGCQHWTAQTTAYCQATCSRRHHSQNTTHRVMSVPCGCVYTVHMNNGSHTVLFLLSGELLPVASPAMGLWGTCRPLNFQQFHFSSL